MKRRAIATGLGLCAAVLMAGCESMGTAAQSKTVQGGVLGSALGAGAGAIIGNQTDHAGAGAAIGAGVGALGGAMVGRGMEEQDRQLSSSQTIPASHMTKFCPVGGELHDESVKYCPVHGVELREKTSASSPDAAAE